MVKFDSAGIACLLDYLATANSLLLVAAVCLNCSFSLSYIDRRALDGGQDGMATTRQLIAVSQQLLTPGG